MIVRRITKKLTILINDQNCIYGHTVRLYCVWGDVTQRGSAQVKTIKHGINSFVYQGGKQWNALPADAKDIEDLNIDKWAGPDCHCGYCVLCATKTL